ncbi:MAG: hypothetical protein Q8N03_01355 [Ignavibacteria bacterium]|nr:hypothetical protein [Ignavibacteria bacterium]
MKLFIVNVGVNKSDSSTRRMKSPVFSDRTFEFIPIKESKEQVKYCDKTSSYRSIKCFNNLKKNLSEYLPDEIHNYFAHNDPDFVNLTYGDGYTSRSGNLQHVDDGDIILFLARLYDYDNVKKIYLKSSSLYFIGKFKVEQNLEYPGPDFDGTVERRVKQNAHYKKLKVGFKGKFRVIVGAKEGSYRFLKAIKITPEIAALLFNSAYDKKEDTFIGQGKTVKNKNGKERKFNNFPQITRSIQYFLDDKNKTDKEALKNLLKIIKKESL